MWGKIWPPTIQFLGVTAMAVTSTLWPILGWDSNFNCYGAKCWYYRNAAEPASGLSVGWRVKGACPFEIFVAACDFSFDFNFFIWAFCFQIGERSKSLVGAALRKANAGLNARPESTSMPIVTANSHCQMPNTNPEDSPNSPNMHFQDIGSLDLTFLSSLGQKWSDWPKSPYSAKTRHNWPTFSDFLKKGLSNTEFVIFNFRSGFLCYSIHQKLLYALLK